MNHLTPLLLSVILTAAHPVLAQDAPPADSGGELIYEQAAYDVSHYELNLQIDPSDRTITGRVVISADIVLPADRIAIDLDPRFRIDGIRDADGNTRKELSFFREPGSKKIMIELPVTRQPGEAVVIEVEYNGAPLVAGNPPWDGGFVWSETPSGDPWVGVAVQSIGSWVWWPGKDHPSDKAETVTLNFTLPDGLIAASNGRLTGTSQAADGWTTWHWFVSSPINNYNITVNAAPYRTISETYHSTSGEEMDIIFWVLPEYYEEGLTLFPQFAEHLRFFEELLGPYPFRDDKYGVAHSPYLGMEHQTIISYGAGFRDGNLFGNSAGFDDLHHHELAHEWWGNLVTAWDWRDYWIHEGFGTYMQALYEEQLNGTESYKEMMAWMRLRIQSVRSVAPREVQSTAEIDAVGNDLYYKGAWFLHTLRSYIGDELFFESLRRFLWLDEGIENSSNSEPVRFVSTDDYLDVVNRLTGEQMDWMFEAYLRQPVLPELNIRQAGREMILSWDVPVDNPFRMPVEVAVNGEVRKVFPEAGVMMLEVPEGASVQVDPENRILMTVNR